MSTHKSTGSCWEVVYGTRRWQEHGLLQAEELIKREMVTMLHYDGLHCPLGGGAKKAADVAKVASSQAEHAAYLQQYSYDSYSQPQINEVQLLTATNRRGTATDSQGDEECITCWL